MSETDGPKRGRKKGEGQQPEPASQGEDTPAANGPAHNPWLAPQDDEPQRRSARMEDILRQRRTGPGSPLSPNTRTMWALGITGVVSAWLIATSIHVLQPNERGIVTTLGRYEETIGSGFNLTMPWPIQSVTKREVGREQTLLMPDKESETLMLTRDGQMIDVRAMLRWRISDLKAFTFGTSDGEAALRRLADSALRAGVAELTFDELRSGKRQAELQQRVAGRLQRVLDGWKAGISVSGIEVTATNPPARLADTFKKIDKANEEARKNHETALARANWIRRSAQVESDAFDKAYELYKIAPGVTRERIYYETIERVLRNNQVVIGGTGAGVNLPPPPADKAAAPAQGGQ